MEHLLLLLFVPLLFPDLFHSGDDNDDADTPVPDVTGTEQDDVLDGTDRAEQITAGGGDDLVVAGSGDDTIQMDEGLDFALGEGRNDFFAVGLDEATDDAVTITDFDGTEDYLLLDVTDLDPSAIQADLTSTTDADNGDVSVFLAGQLVATLTNPADFNLSNVEVFVYQPAWHGVFSPLLLRARDDRP